MVEAAVVLAMAPVSGDGKCDHEAITSSNTVSGDSTVYNITLIFKKSSIYSIKEKLLYK